MNEYVTDLAADTIRLERSLPGPIERVWSYLIDSDKRQTWLARGPIDQNTGGVVELTWENDKLSNESDDDAPENFKGGKTHTMKGRVIACEPPRLLSFTWPGDSGESHVTFELTPKGERVQLVLTHSRLASRDGKIGVSGGWHAHIGILEDILENRTTRPFWKNFTRLHAEYKERL